MKRISAGAQRSAPSVQRQRPAVRRKRPAVRRPSVAAAMVSIRLAWVDRLIRAIDAPPGSPFALAREVTDLRRRLALFRDSFVHGVNVAAGPRDLRP